MDYKQYKRNLSCIKWFAKDLQLACEMLAENETNDAWKAFERLV